MYVCIDHLYAIACHSYTSRKIGVHTARLKRIKRYAYVSKTVTLDLLVQTWLVDLARCSRHGQRLTCNSTSSKKQNEHTILFSFSP